MAPIRRAHNSKVEHPPITGNTTTRTTITHAHDGRPGATGAIRASEAAISVAEAAPAVNAPSGILRFPLKEI